jgi:hypothetical protein
VKLSDFLDLKDQLALALVESIFRRAGYTLTPVTEQRIPPHLGREDLPDFRAVSAVRAEEIGPRHVKVRYRRQVRQYITIEARRGPRSSFAYAKQYWPNLVVVFLTDEPEPGQSCFRALDVATWQPGDLPVLVDLFAHPTLNIYRLNVEEHETLARRILALYSLRRAYRLDETGG